MPVPRASEGKLLLIAMIAAAGVLFALMIVVAAIEEPARWALGWLFGMFGK